MNPLKRWSWSRDLDEGRRPSPARGAREERHRRRLVDVHERLAKGADAARAPLAPEATERLVSELRARIESARGQAGCDPARRAPRPLVRPRLAWAAGLAVVAALALLYSAFPFDRSAPAPELVDSPPTAAPASESSERIPWWLPVQRLTGQAGAEAGAPTEVAAAPLEHRLLAEARLLASDSGRAAQAFLDRLPLPTVGRIRAN